MLDDLTRAKITDDILKSYETGKQIPRLTGVYPDMTIEDSYRIQEAFVAKRVQQGQKIRGYKVGLTSKAMQEMAGSSEPDYSTLTGDLFLPESTPIAPSRFFSPMIELEIAFVMKHALKGPNILPMDVIRATDFIVPAIEIVDFRVELAAGYNIIDSVADLAACGAVVLGGNPCSLMDIDVRRVQGELIKNGKVEEQGEASAVLGNPVTSVAWLANKLSEFGAGFEPGDTVLSGSFIRAIPMSPGDEVVCRLDQGLGDVAVSFEQEK